MRRGAVVPAILLAAWLMPLAVQLGVTLHLLDAAGAPHPKAFVELLVHGHPHGGRVPDHEHATSRGPGRAARVEPSSGAWAPALTCSPGRALAPDGRSAQPAASPQPARPSVPRHLLLRVLLV